MTTNLAGRTAVVTGASSGIGRAIAERLGADGAHVVLGGRTEEAMAQSATRIVAAGGAASVSTGDVRDPAVVEGLVRRALDATGRLDIFVNNAGVAYLGPVLGGTVEQWRTMFDTNVLALLVGCTSAVAAMRSLGTPGHLVNISSVAADEPASGVYGATKHAVNVISRSLRLELLDDPIQVTTILPGVIASNIVRTMDAAWLAGIAAMTGLDVELPPGERIPDDVLERAQAALREYVARPEDVADAVHYAVTVDPAVHIEEITVRPHKDLAL
jgi:NADP-dependent 3-hydroxy acid dehydrogenase YdfG